ncbi:MAG: threonine/serine dehydratase, partial [Gemmatimonadota bacterium]|nr:threonine/serine dehydratase [Gemmatimonadota bacterium]
MSSLLADEIRAAAIRLAPHVARTPLRPARAIGENARFKCENLQHTGSFKLRGALNKILLLSDAQRDAGVVTSSTGNHGLAVAEALRIAGGRGTIVVSSSASPYKVDRLRTAGLEVIVDSDDPMRAELNARALAESTGRVYVSPYNDLEVVAGQGTVGVEIAEQWPEVEAVYIAVGGGGLIAGVATWLNSVKPTVRIVGCWPENASGLLASIEVGKIVEVVESPTLSDGTAGNLEPGAITLPLCIDLIDAHVLVSEREIARAMMDVQRDDGDRIEGAAGVAVAGYRKLVAEQTEYATLGSVIVLCGGNA